ncbi:RNA-binding KH domain-containing protein RCF3-like isoform X2 [Phragmites australis]|uniref:RNA-binding KH domain-containing protein RCF3-like isoform X2 n=1 Tax=Phragmites australis TaxID=29695 RepID=UPI002D7820F6|nr:RNA-binding KH domain-containing protein RCF3-like isoform X2 [Phragmites australis]
MPCHDASPPLLSPLPPSLNPRTPERAKSIAPLLRICTKSNEKERKRRKQLSNLAMDRSRSKRGYHYDQDSTPPRSKPRFDRRSGGGQNPNSSYHRRGPPGGGVDSDRRGFLPPDAAPLPPPRPPSSSAVAGAPGCGPAATTTTSFRILCPESKAYGFPPGFVAKVREDSGALVNVHPTFAGDYVRVIETVDGARREADGRQPMFSPAQEALLTVHRRILETDADDGDEDGEYGPRGKDPRDRGKTTTQLIVPRLHVGCLLGKGGKIIEQMRMETKTHIRILPRDQNTPRSVSLSEEVVQVVGDGNNVKKAVVIISDRLKESLHRDRGPFRGRMNSPEHRISQEDEYLGGTQQMPAYEEPYGRTDQIRNNSGMEPPGYEFDSNGSKVIEHPEFQYDDIVFRILCPNDKANSLVGTRDGIIEVLQADVGIDVRLTDIVAGSDERVVLVTSREGPDHELFPAQEALLHIQTHIVDLGPDKDNIITTRLLVPSTEIAFFEGRDGSLSDIQRQTSANIQILPREDLPSGALESDELIQIVGEIRAARNALMQVTTKLRSYLYREMSGPIQVSNSNVHGSISPAIGSPRGPYQGNDLPMAAYHEAPQLSTSWHSKDSGGSASGSFEQGSNINDDISRSTTKRFAVPLVTRSTLEVVIPRSAAASLTMTAGSKLVQISEMSGATVMLAEDRPEVMEKVIRISGTPEQADKAQSLLQGFILSIQDDIPSV